MPYQTEISIQPFLNSLKFEKRYSVHTIRSYQDDLIQFFDFLQLEFEETEIFNISSAFVRSWLASLKDARLTSKTISRKLSTLKSFFKYQMRIGVIDTSPVAAISAPKVSKRLPSYLDQSEIGTLLKDVEFPDDWSGKTDRLILSVFYNTGMRLSELVNLKEKHIDKYNKTVKVLERETRKGLFL